MNKNGMFEQDLWIIPNVNIGEVRAFPLHYHKHVEFLYILDGETDMDIGAMSYTVKKGDIVLVAPYILHSYTCNSYCLRCITVFEPEAFGFFGDYLVNSHPVCPIISADRVRELVPDTVQKLFSKNMGMGVKEYINFLRIGNAQSLLHDTDLPISDIALSSGFGTIRSFNRAFLRLRGCTPGEYRERAIGWTGRQAKKKVSDET